MPDSRRKGDSRPVHHDKGLSLRLTPEQHEPFRFLPKHGDPYCISEWVSQQTIRGMAFIPIYIAFVTTLTFIVVLWRY